MSSPTLPEVLQDHPKSKRFQMLSGLKKGWLLGEGDTPTIETLTTASLIWDTIFAKTGDRANIWPTPEGGVLLEWGENITFAAQLGNTSQDIRLSAKDFKTQTFKFATAKTVEEVMHAAATLVDDIKKANTIY